MLFRCLNHVLLYYHIIQRIKSLKIYNEVEDWLFLW